MSQRILVMDDDPEVLSLVSAALDAEGYSVRTAATGAQLAALMDRGGSDLFILDLKMPDTHGLDVVQEIRRRSEVGIILMSGAGTEADTVLGLELGADDYIAKPFRVRELRARVKSVLRRTRPFEGPRAAPADPEETLRIGDWTLDTNLRVLRTPSNADVLLSPSEYDIFLMLAEAQGRVLSRQQIVERVRGAGWTANDRLIDGVISRLRKKLVATGFPDPIRTVRGLGYAVHPAAAS